MKTRLINLWKNVVEFVSMMFGLGAIVAITAIAMAVVSVVSNFMATHQWVILIFDITCVVLLTMAIRYRLDRNFQTPKGKWLFWLLFSNVLILIIQSFGALWNFLIILFVLWPIAVGLNQLLKKTFKEIFWWLVDYSDRISIFSVCYAVTLAVLSNKGILVEGVLKITLAIFAMFFLIVSAILFTTEMFFERKIPVKRRRLKTKKR